MGATTLNGLLVERGVTRLSRHSVGIYHPWPVGIYDGNVGLKACIKLSGIDPEYLRRIDAEQLADASQVNDLVKNERQRKGQ